MTTEPVDVLAKAVLAARSKTPEWRGSARATEPTQWDRLMAKRILAALPLAQKWWRDGSMVVDADGTEDDDQHFVADAASDDDAQRLVDWHNLAALVRTPETPLHFNLQGSLGGTIRTPVPEVRTPETLDVERPTTERAAIAADRTWASGYSAGRAAASRALRCNCPESGTSGSCPFHDNSTAVSPSSLTPPEGLLGSELEKAYRQGFDDGLARRAHLAASPAPDPGAPETELDRCARRLGIEVLRHRATSAAAVELAQYAESAADGFDRRWELAYAEDATRLRNPAEVLLVNTLRRKAAEARSLVAPSAEPPETADGD